MQRPRRRRPLLDEERPGRSSRALHLDEEGHAGRGKDGAAWLPPLQAPVVQERDAGQTLAQLAAHMAGCHACMHPPPPRAKAVDNRVRGRSRRSDLTHPRPASTPSSARRCRQPPRHGGGGRRRAHVRAGAAVPGTPE
eukprot:scaffold55_cov401-Prasinococcus_capsulatus_cf.AAC.3